VKLATLEGRGQSVTAVDLERSLLPGVEELFRLGSQVVILIVRVVRRYPGFEGVIGGGDDAAADDARPR